MRRLATWNSYTQLEVVKPSGCLHFGNTPTLTPSHKSPNPHTPLHTHHRTQNTTHCTPRQHHQLTAHTKNKHQETPTSHCRVQDACRLHTKETARTQTTNRIPTKHGRFSRAVAVTPDETQTRTMMGRCVANMLGRGTGNTRT